MAPRPAPDLDIQQDFPGLSLHDRIFACLLFLYDFICFLLFASSKNLLYCKRDFVHEETCLVFQELY